MQANEITDMLQWRKIGRSSLFYCYVNIIDQTSSPVTRTRIGEQKRCTRKKLRIFGVFSRFRGKNYKGYTVDAFG
jgi:hypothetical protein